MSEIIYQYSREKSVLLKEERNISFEDIIYYINSGYVLDILNHPNKDKYPNQKMFVVNVENYAYIVPYVRNNDIIFLKTIFPSRKATKKYIVDRRAKNGRSH